MMDGEKAIMEIAHVEQAIRWQADHCTHNSAPCTGRLLLGFLALLDSNLAIAARMRDWPGLALGDAMPLRLAGGFHYLHLTQADDRLGPIYRGELTAQEDVDAVVLAVARTHDAALLAWFAGPPQTNEAGRSAGVMAALGWLTVRLGAVWSLFEIGSSAGINTMLDRFSFDLGGVKVGDPASLMRIAPEWRGLPPPDITLKIKQIRGCDVAPLDLTDPAQALRLKSYVWAETTERLRRIDAAIALANQRQPDVARHDAAEFVTQVLDEPAKYGEGRALFHSIVWQYLPPETRSTITTAMERASAKATAQSPLAWIKVETNRQTFRHEIRVRYWPGGEEETVLGMVHAHGAWLEWLAP